MVREFGAPAMRDLGFLGLETPKPLKVAFMRAVVTGGTIAGIIISNQILGNQHPWSDVRPPLRLYFLGLTSAFGSSLPLSSCSGSIC